MSPTGTAGSTGSPLGPDRRDQPPGTRIIHIAFPEAWTAARSLGLYSHPSLESEGFIHCSTPGQLRATAARHFAPGEELVLLELDPARLAVPGGGSRPEGPELVWEKSGDHGVFPHVYGPIPVTAIVAEHRWNAGDDLPAEFLAPPT